MDIKQLKKELGISNKKIAEFFDLNYSSFANSTAKERYENALCKFYEFIKESNITNMRPWHEVIVISKGNAIEKYNSLEDVCESHPELILKDITGYSFPFTYKGWDFNKVQYRTKAE